MSDERDIRVNTLNRFAKVSENLVVEQYSSCEVPAGCGGMVLRWQDPEEGEPILFRCASSHESTLILDGEELATSRRTLGAGSHMLCLRLTAKTEAPTEGYLVLRMTGDRPGFTPIAAPVDASSTSPDGTWRFDTTEPRDDAWIQADFDDSGWGRLDRAVVPDEGDSALRWRLTALLREGATAIALPPTRALWIRKRFDLER